MPQRSSLRVTSPRAGVAGARPTYGDRPRRHQDDVTAAEVGVERSDNADWLDAVCDDTETGRLVRDFDWQNTSLGHPGTWPLGLRAAVRMCMTTRFPMLVVWGPELVKIYNHGYRELSARRSTPVRSVLRRRRSGRRSGTPSGRSSNR